MIKFPIYTTLITILSGCASINPDSAKLEKYPHCYHQYRTIFERCVERNENGEKITAFEIENQEKELTKK